MSELVNVNNQDLTIKEYQGQRVVTFKDIDMVHERPEGTASRNFKSNRDKFIDGEDYFIITKNQKDEFRPLEIPNRGLTLITESGYLMLVKSLTDDLAWKVQRELVKCYFKVQEEKEVPLLKKQEVEAKLNNSRARLAQVWLKIADIVNIPEYKQIISAKAAETLAGQAILPLPTAERPTYSAKEIGIKFGVSGNKIGKLANQYNLKTPEYGKLFYDKSPHSCKEVETWRYYDTVIPVIEQLLGKEVLVKC